MPTPPPSSMSAKSAAGWKASSPPAGIPPRCAPWPTEPWWSSTARDCGPTPTGRTVPTLPSASNRCLLGTAPNRAPPAAPPPPAVQYVGRLQTGTASWIEPFPVEQLNAWTARTLANSPYRDEKLDERSPLPEIQHVIYIVKENRSYDQVLGDLKEGNGDPSLVLFGENSTPNLHKLAREFVL